MTIGMKIGLLVASLLLAVQGLLCGPWPAVALAEESSRQGEYLLKTAFLYNFAKFVEWPDDSASGSDVPLTLCLMGDYPVEGTLDSIAGKTVRGRKLSIMHVRSVVEAKKCHLLYLAPSEIARLAEVVQGLQNDPVLTVCDVDGCAQAGVMIAMRMEQQRIHLDINLAAVQRTPLKMSAQLIKLSRVVSHER
jgi:YfiR/HmsC-like